MGSRVPGSGRLRGDLAGKVARQIANVYMEVRYIYSYVENESLNSPESDSTLSHVLFQVSPQARRWSDEEVYSMLGQSWTEEIRTMDDSPPGPHAPHELVQPVGNYDFSSPSSFLEENIVVTDLGQSYDITTPPKDYKPGTSIGFNFVIGT